MGSAPRLSPESLADEYLARLSPRLERVARWLLARAPGRIALNTAVTCIRIELFDRSMAIAAQFFTSVFPILITFAVWFGGGDTGPIAEAVSLPDESRSVLDQALDEAGHTSATFGIVSTLIVLISATSLSRALTRAFASIWELPRPKSTLRSAWRWLAVVIALALSLVLTRALAEYAGKVPPADVWDSVVSLTGNVAVAMFVPWLLLAGVVPPRRLLPGALLFALVMLVVRPASGIWLPKALEISAEKYGSIGVAFTYLAWLYIVSFCLLTSAVLGRVLATDSSRFGAWIRGDAKQA